MNNLCVSDQVRHSNFDKESSCSQAKVSPKIDRTAITEFLEFLEKNKDNLRSGMGAFHTDNHSNW